MAGKKSSKPKEERRTFMIPWLDQEVVDAVSNEIASPWFQENDSDEGCNKRYETYMMGKFECSNNDCSKNGWGSKKVAIVIRGYPGNGYNAVVYNQRCESCNWLGIFTPNEKSYVDLVAYRLKKWAGVAKKRPYYKKKEGLPHKRSLCEGCKSGVCRQANDWD
jgi:hypothetical protein